MVLLINSPKDLVIQVAVFSDIVFPRHLTAGLMTSSRYTAAIEFVAEDIVLWRKKTVLIAYFNIINTKLLWIAQILDNC